MLTFNAIIDISSKLKSQHLNSEKKNAAGRYDVNMHLMLVTAAFICNVDFMYCMYYIF